MNRQTDIVAVLRTKTDETESIDPVLRVFIVDMTLHVFEMMYKKCNRTENGSDEVELSHRLAGMKTTQYKNKNNPEKSN